MRFLAVIGLMLFFSFFGAAQKLSENASRPYVLVGESVTISYSIVTKKGDSIQFNPFYDSLPAQLRTSKAGKTSKPTGLEITTLFKDSSFLRGSELVWNGQYEITPWDSGYYTIPGADVVINDSTYHFGDLQFLCKLVDKKNGIDLYDIHENFADIPERTFPEKVKIFVKKNWWWVSLVVIALVVLFFLLRRRRVEDDEPEDIKPISLKQRTILAIEALEKERLWERDQLKEHFVELSFILRSYLGNRYQINLLEMTTSQTRLILKRKGLHDETIESIIRVLSQSDMVKFAKSHPDEMSILKQSTLAKQIVAETSPLDFDNVD